MNQYCGIEALSLTADQKATLVDGLQTLAANLDRDQPCDRNHWRIRPDNNALIFQADWPLNTITPEVIKTRLVNLFNVNPNLVTYTTTQTPYGPVLTFRYNSTNRLRMILFGGPDATFPESWAAVQSYLSDNKADW